MILSDILPKSATPTLPPGPARVWKAVLINGAQPLVGVQNQQGTVRSYPYDTNQNFGRVSLIDSLPLSGENQLKAKFVDRKEIRNGVMDRYPLVIGSSGCSSSTTLSAALVWHDPPGAASCRTCLLNDLDLYVTNDAGEKFYPNGLNSKDSVNNAERVQLTNLSSGERYIVHVSASDLEESPQKYSLVITGCFREEGDLPPILVPEEPEEEEEPTGWWCGIFFLSWLC